MRFLALTLSLLLAIAFAACEKDKLTTSETTELNLFGELAPATISAYGQLIDDAGNPVADARVQAGDVSTTTDVQGLWHLDNAKVKATFGYITFESEKHLHGSRTIYAREGSLYEVNVELLRRDQTFTVDAAAGGTVQLPGSTATVVFGPGAFAKTDGAPITSGSVSVVAHYLDPNDARTYDRMPGDLRGVSLNAEGNPGRDLTLLTSYGMMAVELITDGGARATLAEGQTAALTMPLTGAAASTAPNSIPMWYFDEEAGVWVEEGVATRQGNAYVGTVSHFTFWNCDVPSDFVELCGNVGFTPSLTERNTRTTPLQVRIKSARFGTRTAFVDAKGDFCGLVPSDERMDLEILGDCGEVVFTKSIGPYSDNTVLDPFIVPSDAARLMRVSGRATCDGAPIVDAAVSVNQEGSVGVTQRVNADGTFTVEFVSCSASPVEVIAIDYAGLKQSSIATFELRHDIDAGEFDACTSEIETYMRLTIDDKVLFFSETALYQSQGEYLLINSIGENDAPGSSNLSVLVKPDLVQAAAGTYLLPAGARVSVFLADAFIYNNYDLIGATIISSKSTTGSRVYLSAIIEPTSIVMEDRQGNMITVKLKLEFAFYER